MTKAILLGLCLALTACGSHTVVLRNPESGIIVRCGSERGDEGQQRCIRDFQSRGFEPESK